MRHRLVDSVEKAFGWSGSSLLGKSFAWGKLPETALCSRLLTPERFMDLVMRRSLSPPQFRCLQGGQDLHPREYMTAMHTRRGQAIPMVDMDRFGRLVAEGVTTVLDSTNTFDPTLEIACRALQWWSGELVKVNTYLTTKDTAGFDLHWDDHDVIVVQLAGTKSWEVRGVSRVAPMFRDAQPTLEPSDSVVWSGTMVAGDVMHIPRGYWHQATRADRLDSGAEEDYSLHVTFGLEQRTGVDWISWLTDQAREHEIFRQDLDRNAEASTMDRLVDELTRLAASHRPEDFLTARQRVQRPSRHRYTGSTFGAPTTVACITEFRPELHIAEDGSVAVVAAGRRIRFAARALPALRLLLSGHPVVVQDVTTATGVNAAGVVQTLLQENICGEVGEDLLSGYTDLLIGAHS